MAYASRNTELRVGPWLLRFSLLLQLCVLVRLPRSLFAVSRCSVGGCSVCVQMRWLALCVLLCLVHDASAIHARRDRGQLVPQSAPRFKGQRDPEESAPITFTRSTRETEIDYGAPLDEKRWKKVAVLGSREPSTPKSQYTHPAVIVTPEELAEHMARVDQGPQEEVSTTIPELPPATGLAGGFNTEPGDESFATGAAAGLEPLPADATSDAAAAASGTFESSSATGAAGSTGAAAPADASMSGFDWDDGEDIVFTSTGLALTGAAAEAAREAAAAASGAAAGLSGASGASGAAEGEAAAEPEFADGSTGATGGAGEGEGDDDGYGYEDGDAGYPGSTGDGLDGSGDDDAAAQAAADAAAAAAAAAQGNDALLAALTRLQTAMDDMRQRLLADEAAFDTVSGLHQQPCPVVHHPFADHVLGRCVHRCARRRLRWSRCAR